MDQNNERCIYGRICPVFEDEHCTEPLQSCAYYTVFEATKGWNKNPPTNPADGLEQRFEITWD